MITEYRRSGGGEKLTRADADLATVADGVVWLDAFNPDDGELDQLSAAMGFDVPNRHDMTEIELSSRLYKDDGIFVMIANLLPRSGQEVLPPRPAAFIVKRDLLLTIRYSPFFSFDKVSAAVPTRVEKRTPQSIFCDILDEVVSDRADDLEFLIRRLEDLTSTLFQSAGKANESPESPELDDALRRIGGMGERVASVRESITSLQRVINFAQTYIPDDWMPDGKTILASMKNDLTALSDEAGFFMNKLAFNLDATLGMINIEETKIIRVLSMVALVFSPPTLIAGVYGMNFANMPELTWPGGYGFALVLMLGTAFLPLAYLRWKKWF